MRQSPSKRCAAELEAALWASQKGREAMLAEYSKHTPDCTGWQANCLDLRLCNCKASAPSEIVPRDKKMQEIIRAEENKPSPEVSSPPQEPTGDSSPLAPEEK
jgi:hypothetical protein